MRAMQPVPLHLRVQGAAGRALLKLPRPALVRLSGGRRVTRDGCVLDEQLQCMLFVAERLGRGLTDRGDVAAARAAMDLDAHVFAPPPAALASADDDRVRDDLNVRVYRPRDLAAPSPAVVVFHGGADPLGGLTAHHRVPRALAPDARCVVISVDYRLAPEHAFPAAADDATEAFRWVIREAARLGVDPARVAVAGDSAGGNLAAVVALDTRADTQRPRLQALVYPVVDNTRSFPSARIMSEGFLLTEESIAWFRAQYVPDASQWRHPRASPWFAPDLAGLPPALVQTAGFDPLRDEGEAYASRLRDAGVPVEARRYPSLIHGYLNLTGSVEAAREPWSDLVFALRGAFA